jgi:hypothetical protein
VPRKQFPLLSMSFPWPFSSFVQHFFLFWFASCSDLLGGLSSSTLHTFLSHLHQDKRHMQGIFYYFWRKTWIENFANILPASIMLYACNSLVLGRCWVRTIGIAQKYVLHPAKTYGCRFTLAFSIRNMNFKIIFLWWDGAKDKPVIYRRTKRKGLSGPSELASKP